MAPQKTRSDVERTGKPSGTDDAGKCAITGNVSRNGRIYHLPGQKDDDCVRIDINRGERMFCNEKEARSAGWRRAAR